MYVQYQINAHICTNISISTRAESVLMFTCPPCCICGSTILNYLNIHHCEARRKASCLCLASAPCMTINVLHNHEPATRPHVCAAQHAPAHFHMQKCKMGDRKTQTFKLQTHFTPPPVPWGHFSGITSYSCSSNLHSIPLIAFPANMCPISVNYHQRPPQHHKIWMYLLTCKHLHLVLPPCPGCLPQWWPRWWDARLF